MVFCKTGPNGKRYTDYDKMDLANLARARAALGAASGAERSAFTPEEADHRVAFYAAQIEASGQITRWMEPVPPKPTTRYRTRFAFGDALGRH
jgi:hypothetical protein